MCMLIFLGHALGTLFFLRSWGEAVSNQGCGSESSLVAWALVLLANTSRILNGDGSGKMSQRCDVDTRVGASLHVSPLFSQ